MLTTRFAASTAVLFVAIAHAPALAQRSAEFIPDSVSVAVIMEQPDEQLKDLRALLERHRFVDTSLYESIDSNPGLMQARIGLLGIAAAAKTDSWSAVGAVLGKEMTIALQTVENEKPEVIIVSIARDTELMDRLIQTIRKLAGVSAEGNDDRSNLVGDVRYYPIGEGFECRVNDALILTNSKALMEAALSAHNDKSARLSDLETFRDSSTAAANGCIAWAHVDPAIFKAITEQDNTQLINNPLGGMLFGGWQQVLSNTVGVSASVSELENGLALNVAVTSDQDLPATHAGFAPPGMHPLAWSSDSLSGFLGEIAITRGWGKLFAERESFLTLPAASQFVNFTSTLTTLMGRLDFVDDVLDKTSGPTRLIMARQDFEGRDYTPSPQLPAFALVAPLQIDAPERFARQIYSSGLGALSVIGLDAAQKGNPSLLVDAHEYEGVRIVSGEYLEPEMDDDGMVLSPGGAAASIQYNFEPAIAMIGREFVVTTSVDLMHQLIDIASTTNETVSEFSLEDSAVVDVGQLVRVLRDNHDELIADRMLKEDQSREAATRDIEAILAALGYADEFRITVVPGAHRYEARVELSLHEPK